MPVRAEAAKNIKNVAESNVVLSIGEYLIFSRGLSL